MGLEKEKGTHATLEGSLEERRRKGILPRPAHGAGGFVQGELSWNRAHREKRWTELVGTHLPAVVVGGRRRALEVLRVQTGPPYVGLAHLRFVQQFPNALKGGKGAQLLE